MNILQNNPFRTLGVYANSSTKERLANVSRIKAFLKVGKPVSFPLDFSLYLPAVNRSEVTVADAGSKLTLPKDQMLYAQFWFVKITQIDEVAFNHLIAGKMAEAEELWKKDENASSLQNQIVCSLIRKNYSEAIKIAEILYSNSSYVSLLVSAVIGDNGSIESDGLAFRFLDTLSDEIGATELLTVVAKTDWKKHIAEKSISPLIESIENAIATAKQSQGKDASTRLKAGETLQKDTNSALQELRKLIPSSDLRYQATADKLGLAILQCGIDYFNGSDDPDAVFKAMKLQSYANGIVVGQMAKDRCKENVGILQEIIDNLPPQEVFEEDMAIKNELREYSQQPEKICYAVELLNITKPYLKSIKKKLGKNNGYYLKISTLVVSNALGNVIEEVNDAQNNLATLDMKGTDDQLLAAMNHSAFDDYLRINLRRRIELRDIVSEAWKAMLLMDSFDKDRDFKIRYEKNRKVLKDLCKALDVSNNDSSSRDRTIIWILSLIALLGIVLIVYMIWGTGGFGILCIILGLLIVIYIGSPLNEMDGLVGCLGLLVHLGLIYLGIHLLG